MPSIQRRLGLVIALAGSSLACSTMVTATAGPVISYVPNSGFGFGWSFNSSFSGLLVPSSSSGYGLTMGFGQSWRPHLFSRWVAPLTPSPGPGESGYHFHTDKDGWTWASDASQAPPAVESFERGTEAVTYIDFGLTCTLAEALPSYGQIGFAVGPSWSSDPSAQPGVMADLAPSVAFVPGNYSFPSCGQQHTEVVGPTFVAILGVRWLHGAFEVYLSPQFGIAWENFNDTCFAIAGN